MFLPDYLVRIKTECTARFSHFIKYFQFIALDEHSLFSLKITSSFTFVFRLNKSLNVP